MVKHVFPAVLSGIVGFGMMVGSAAAQAPEQCAAPSLVIPASAREMPRTSAALSRKQDLRIVAVGSSSTQGTGSSGPAMTYPAQLDRILETRFPGARIEVVNKGIGGEKAAATLARLDRDVLARAAASGEAPLAIIEREGLGAGLDEGALAAAVAEVLAAHPDKVEAYRRGKTALLGFFTGQVMRATGGKADPVKVAAALRGALSGG